MKLALRFLAASACAALVVMAVHYYREEHEASDVFRADHEKIGNSKGGMPRSRLSASTTPRVAP